MSDLQTRLEQAQERLNTSFAALSTFAANRVLDMLEHSVDVVERTVSNITATAPADEATGSQSTASTNKAGSRTRTPQKRTRAKAHGGGRTTITPQHQAKIREGFDRGMTTKEIAKFAGVSQSSAVRYTASLRK